MPQDAPVDIPHHPQETDHTCGPAALRMVLDAIWGICVEEASLAHRLDTDPVGGTRQKIMLRFMEDLGLQAHVRHTDTSVDEIRQSMAAGFVVVVCYWLTDEDTDHYAVVSRISRDEITLADPWHGPETVLPIDVFEASWLGDPGVPTRRDRWLLAVQAG